MIPESARLSALSPAAIAAYLAAHGWQSYPHPVADTGAVWYVLDTKGHTAATVLVPLRTDWYDYPARVLDALRAVAAAEQRPGPEWAILAEMEQEHQSPKV